MVRPFAWLLDRVGPDGLTLTAAGWLPPAVVSAAMDATVLLAVQLLADGRSGLRELADAVAFGLGMIGWGNEGGGQLDEWQVVALIGPTWHALIDLGVFERDRWNIGPITEGGRAFARAMLQN